jgi:hypothetical protein
VFNMVDVINGLPQMGRKPFGSYEGEAAALERMKALRAEGLGFDRIAERLNGEGFPTRTGRKWHGPVINRILAGQAEDKARNKTISSVRPSIRDTTNENLGVTYQIIGVERPKPKN